MKRIISLVLVMVVLFTSVLFTPINVQAIDSEEEIVTIDDTNEALLSQNNASLYGAVNYVDYVIITNSSYSNGLLHVSWSEIPDAVSYKVYVAEYTSNTYRRVATTLLTSIAIQGLANGTYKIRVNYSTDGTNYSDLSACPYREVHVGDFTPKAASNVVAVIDKLDSDGTPILSVSWDKSSTATRYGIFVDTFAYSFFDLSRPVYTADTEIDILLSDAYTADMYIYVLEYTDNYYPISGEHWKSSYDGVIPKMGLYATSAEIDYVNWSDQDFTFSVYEDGTVQDPKTYNHDLARVAAALSSSAYKEQEVKKDLKLLGFTDIEQTYTKPTSSNYNIVSYSFAQKPIYDNNVDDVTLVAIVIKGTGGDAEWYSNFDIGMGNTHYGFNKAAEGLLNSLDDYLNRYGLDKQKTRFYVTGHSRGAAVANLVAANLTDCQRNNLYAIGGVWAYTFASPNVSTLATDVGYENIFNIVNREDFVTRVPLAEWGYKRYGIDLTLPSRSYGSTSVGASNSQYDDLYSTFSYYYTLLTGEKHVRYDGTQAVDGLCSMVYQMADNVELYYTKYYTSSLKNKCTLDDYFMEVAAILAGDGDVGSLINKSLLSKYWWISDFFYVNHIYNDRIMSTHGADAYFAWLRLFESETLFNNNGVSFGPTRLQFKRLTVKCPVDVYVYDESGVLVASVVNNEVVCNTLAVGVYGDEKVIDLPNDQEYSIQIIATDEGVVNYTVEEISIEGADATTVRTVRFDDIEINVNDTLTGSISEEQHNPAIEYQLIQNSTSVVNVDYDSDTASNSCNGNHSYGEWTDYSDTEHKRICSSCNYAEYEIHNWDWENGEANDDDSVTYDCADCDATTIQNTEAIIPGDLNGDAVVDRSDAIYLLYYSIFGAEDYPINQSCDYTHDGLLDRNDAIYLLYHSIFGAEDYPLS